MAAERDRDAAFFDGEAVRGVEGQVRSMKPSAPCPGCAEEGPGLGGAGAPPGRCRSPGAAALVGVCVALAGLTPWPRWVAGGAGGGRDIEVEGGARRVEMVPDSRLMPAGPLAFSPDGGCLAAAAPGRVHPVCLWDMSSGRCITRIEVGTPVWSLAFSRGGRRVLCGTDGGISVWGVEKGCRQGVAQLADKAVSSLAVSGSGEWVASGVSDGTVRIWRARTLEQLAVLRGHEGPVLGVAFAPEGGRVASVGRDGTVRVWDWRGRKGRVLWRGKSGLHAVAWSACGRFLAFGEWDTVVVWDVRRGQIAAKGIDKGAGYLLAVGFSPDSSRVATGWGGDWRETLWLRVFDVQSGRLTRLLRGASGTCDSLAFSPDGRFLASAHADGAVRLWNWRGGELVLLFGACGEGWAAYTPQGYFTGSAAAPEGLVEWLVRGAPGAGRRSEPFDRYAPLARRRPDVVRLALKLGSAARAIARLGAGHSGHAGPSASLGVRAKHYAIVVGIDGYPADVGRLRFCGRDAKALAEVLRTCCGVPKENIVVLTDDQADVNLRPSVTSIMTALENVREAGRGEGVERVYFMFSGHGYAMGRENYLLMPSVTARDLASPRVAARVLPKKSVAISELKEALLDTGAKQILVFLDACRDELRAGRAVGVGRNISVIMNENFDRLQLPEGLVIIRATRAGRTSQESDSLRHGLFTYVLLQALRGGGDQNQDGRVTLDELVAFLEGEMPKVARQKNLAPQRPALSISEGSRIAGMVVAGVR